MNKYHCVILFVMLTTPLCSGLNEDLMEAVKQGDMRLANELLSKGANINAKAKSGNTVLQFAAGVGNIEIVKHLIYKGAKVNEKDLISRTALDLVKTDGIRQFLIKHGAKSGK